MPERGIAPACCKGAEGMMEADMTTPKDRMTIFPEKKSGEASKPADKAERSLKRDETQTAPLGDKGQKQAKDFRDDQGRQNLGGKMGHSKS
ncbi:MAG TPA: hypothetical protein VFO41_00210 [Alphaproteobacteria bacterium]|nr:hypothetical protein [Alphaproteobacteria bacterium]